jgi:hypothetical protein
MDKWSSGLLIEFSLKAVRELDFISIFRGIDGYLWIAPANPYQFANAKHGSVIF